MPKELKDVKEVKEVKDDIIVEKNLFSPDRKKWVSEPKKQPGDRMATQEIGDITLLGTVVSTSARYAVLRAKKDGDKAGYRPYMLGDYVQGYLLKEIEDKKVVLVDEAAIKEYELYMNDEKKERATEKTDLKPEPPRAGANDKKEDQAAKKRKKRPPPKQPPIPADAPDVVRQAMEKNMAHEEEMRNAPQPELPENIRRAIEQSGSQEE